MTHSVSSSSDIDIKLRKIRLAQNKKPLQALQNGLQAIERHQVKLPPQRLALAEQPLDSLLLSRSATYKKSRALYMKMGGQFKMALVSSPRTLSSAILLEKKIEYSPTETELFWCARAGEIEQLEEVRGYTASLFHEQKHRIFWDLLPSIPSGLAFYRRYLNLAESLVIMMDMALGDELGEFALFSYMIGSTYDPGTTVKQELSNRRHYRNYLQAAMYATYLNLELYEPKDVTKVIRALFPAAGVFAERAARRASNLDQAFILRTNQVWQKKNRKQALEKLTKSGAERLELPASPLDNRVPYLLAEKVLDLMGI